MIAKGALRVVLPLLFLSGALPLTLRAQPAAAPQQLAQPREPAQTGPAAPGAVAVTPLPAATEAGGDMAAAEPSQPVTPPAAWLPRQTAELQVVEKINATRRVLDVPVGKTAKVDKLTISVKACVIRPPGQQDDAAAYLDITGKNAQSPSFAGWMLAAEPAVSLFKDPLYDVRVVGCR